VLCQGAAIKRINQMEEQAQQNNTITPWGGSWIALAQQVTPTSDDHQKIQAAFVALKKVLAAGVSSSHKISRILKAGSYGKGTICRMRLELDVVLYMEDYTPDRHEETLRFFLALFEKSAPGFTQVRKVTHAIKMLFNQSVSIDLLPTTTLLEGAMGFIPLSPTHRDLMSAAAAKDQCTFIKEQSQLYKDLVRVAKFWRKQITWATKAVRPSSYLLELLMLHAYQQHYASMAVMKKDGTKRQMLASIFRDFLKSVTEMNATTFICWNAFYSETVARQHIFTTPARKDGDKRNPVIVDPANPTNDVANRMHDWGPFVAYAQATLKHFDKQEMVGLSRMVSELRSEKQVLQEEIKLLREDITRLRKAAFHRSVVTVVTFAPFQPEKDSIQCEVAGLKWKIHFRHNKERYQVGASLELLSESAKELGESGWCFSVTCTLAWQSNNESSFRNEVKAPLSYQSGKTHFVVTDSWFSSTYLSQGGTIKVKATITM